MSVAVRAFIGLGGNLGDPVAELRRALAAIESLPETRLQACSTFYRSAPWGPIAQPDFINAVAEIVTALPPDALMQGLLAIEQAAGRERRERWGPRVLDLDLLLYGDLQLDTEQLQVPHPRLPQRPFVLVPLAELAPDLHVPGHGALRDLCRRLDRSSVEALG